MAKARLYPLANHTAQWWEDKFTRGTMDPVDKLLLHTTETGNGWPGYQSGALAPNLTYNPWVAAGQRWRQHNYLNTSSRALVDPSSTVVRENRDGVVQVEIVAYCDPALYAKYGYAVKDLPASAYEDLGAFLAFLHREWSVPLARAPQWLTYPASGRADSPIRMSGTEYDAFKGVLGHQHASGNIHGDPGMTNAQVDRILAVANRITKPPATPPSVATPPKEPAMTAAEAADALAAHIHAKSDAVQVEALLSRLSLTVPPRPKPAGDNDAYYAHYWAKRTAALLPLIAAELARLGFPKKV